MVADGPELSELRAPYRVIPIVETKSDVGWSLTAIALELHDDGFRITFRTLGPPSEWCNPELALRVRDDRGSEYRLWGGGGNGEPSTACHWRTSVDGAPAIDAAVQALDISIDEVRLMKIEPRGDAPDTCLVAVDRSFRGRWDFRVALV